MAEELKVFMLTEGQALALYAAALSAEAANKRFGHPPDPDMVAAREALLKGAGLPEELDAVLASLGCRLTGAGPEGVAATYRRGGVARPPEKA